MMRREGLAWEVTVFFEIRFSPQRCVDRMKVMIQHCCCTRKGLNYFCAALWIAFLPAVSQVCQAGALLTSLTGKPVSFCCCSPVQPGAGELAVQDTPSCCHPDTPPVTNTPTGSSADPTRMPACGCSSQATPMFTWEPGEQGRRCMPEYASGHATGFVTTHGARSVVTRTHWPPGPSLCVHIDRRTSTLVGKHILLLN